MVSPLNRKIVFSVSVIATICYIGISSAIAIPSILGDLDEDGAITVSDLTILIGHLQGDAILPVDSLPFADVDQVGGVGASDVLALADLILAFGIEEEIPLLSVYQTTPQMGESDVAVTRETVMQFSLPLAEGQVLTNDNFYALFSGRKITTRIELSSDRLNATLFYLEQLPANARIRVVFDPEGLVDFKGRDLDLDDDGKEGGIAIVDFNTVSTQALPGTAIGGFVYAAELSPGDVNVPLQGVVIEVVGAEETLRTTTSADGSFLLDPSPAGRFFVNIDGRPVTGGFPDGDYYPFVGKAWKAQAGRKDNLVNGTGEIFLPLIKNGTLSTVSQTEETMIGFPQAILDESPELEGVEVMIPANSLFSENGVRGGRVGIAPVPPDRIPEPLPEGLNLPLVITVQTDGPQNFDRPASVKFPNVADPVTGEKLRAGSKSALWSFNHDSGLWEIGGPMTVSDDGLFVTSDPGVGIRQPGWHGTLPGTSNPGGGGARAPSRGPSGPTPGDPKDCKVKAALALSGYIQSFYSTGIAVPAALADYTFAAALPVGVSEAASLGINSLGAKIDSLIDPSQTVSFWEGAARNNKIGAPGSIPKVPLASGIFSYLALLDSWKSTGERLGDLAGCLAPIPLDLLSTGGDEVFYSLLSTQSFSDFVVAAEFLEDEYPLLAKFESYLDLQFDYLQAGIDFNVSFLGSEIWIDAMTDERASTEAFIRYAFGLLVGDFEISSQERAELLASARRPAKIDDSELNAFIDMMNRRSVDGLLESERLEMIDALQRMKQALETIVDVTPYPDPNFFWNFYMPELWKELFPPPPPVQINAGGGTSSGSSGDGGSGGGGSGGGGSGATAAFAAEPGEHPYLLKNIHSGFERRGQTNKLGQFDNLILPPNSVYTAFYYRPESKEMAISIFRTPESGQTNYIPVSYFRPYDGFLDTDGDGIPDDAEIISGTDPENEDSDDDGVLDGAELNSGTDPLDGRPTATGVIAKSGAPGIIIDLEARNDILAAVGEDFLVLYDVRNPLNPSQISVTDIPNTARVVAMDGAVVAIAAEEGGLLVYDISDTVAPRLRHRLYSFDGAPLSVAMTGNIAFVGTSTGKICSVDLITGFVLAEFDSLLDQRIIDITGDDKYLYVRGVSGIATFEKIGTSLLNRTDSFTDATLTTTAYNRGHLFLGEGILLSTSNYGYSTWDLANRAQPALESHNDLLQFGGWKQISLNGSGLLLVTSGASGNIGDGQHNIDIYDVGAFGFETSYVSTLETVGVSYSLGIYYGLLFVGGVDGLTVINYLATDTDAISPTISLFPESGASAEEGGQLNLVADATDDVQVRSVSFFVDDELVAIDGNYPFSTTLSVPLLGASVTDIEAYAVVSDTGGYSSQTSKQVYTISEDATPPSIGSYIPRNNEPILPTNRIGVVPIEELDPDSYSTSTFYVVAAGPDSVFNTVDDFTVLGESIEVLDSEISIYLNFPDVLDPGYYEMRFEAGADLSGNSLSTSYTSNFFVLYPNDLDTDLDGLPDAYEVLVNLDPFNPDTNDNNFPDGEEILLDPELATRDVDFDGLSDKIEIEQGTSLLRPDTDGDLLEDGAEFLNGEDPLVPTVLKKTVAAPVIQYQRNGGGG